MNRRALPAFALTFSLLVAACGGGGSDTATAAGIETVAAERFAEIIDDAPDGLVILDIRTPEEFAAGHIAGAINIDYYQADFRVRLDALDRDVPYAFYCRSGNRSSDTRMMMQELGFLEAYELGGGVVSWDQAGYPLTR